MIGIMIGTRIGTIIGTMIGTVIGTRIGTMHLVEVSALLGCFRERLYRGCVGVRCTEICDSIKRCLFTIHNSETTEKTS